MSAGTVVVTGSASGLGLQTALHLAGRRFDVYATVRDLDSVPAVKDAAAARGVSLKTRRLDLADPDSARETIDSVVSEAGGILALVNNGGIGMRGCLEDTTDAEVRRVFEANVFGTIAVTKAVLPHMRAAGRGRIITISSVGGRISSFGVSVYCATKFAEEGLTEGLALEIAPFGLHAVLIEPGIIKTTRWSTNRGLAESALDPDSAYHDLFRASEVVSDGVVNRSKTTASDVAEAVYRAMTDPKPKLRYVVGRPASAAILLRRYLPERLFEKLYFGGLMRKIQGKAPATLGGDPESGRVS